LWVDRSSADLTGSTALKHRFAVPDNALAAAVPANDECRRCFCRWFRRLRMGRGRRRP